jgi:hypothetical protein
VKKKRKSLLSDGHIPRTPAPVPRRPSKPVVAEPRSPAELPTIPPHEPPPVRGAPDEPSETLFEASITLDDEPARAQEKGSGADTEIHTRPSAMDTLVLAAQDLPLPVAVSATAMDEVTERDITLEHGQDDREVFDADVTLETKRSQTIDWRDPVKLDMEATQTRPAPVTDASADALVPPTRDPVWLAGLALGGLGLMFVGGAMCAGLLGALGWINAPAPPVVDSPVISRPLLPPVKLPESRPVGELTAPGPKPSRVVAKVAPSPVPNVAPAAVSGPKPTAEAVSGGTTRLVHHVETDKPDEIWFIQGDQRLPFSAIGEGQWEIEARFGDGQLTFAGELEIGPEQDQVQILCSASWGKCRGVQ